LNKSVYGWIGYYRLAETPSVVEAFDAWIRRRLRMCPLKQWEKPKTRRRKLIGLGILEEPARMIGGSRKGYWRLSNTPQEKNTWIPL
jgi:hypothetical protein